jgi:hypothetical protein
MRTVSKARLHYFNFPLALRFARSTNCITICSARVAEETNSDSSASGRHPNSRVSDKSGRYFASWTASFSSPLRHQVVGESRSASSDTRVDWTAAKGRAISLKMAHGDLRKNENAAIWGCIHTYQGTSVISQREIHRYCCFHANRCRATGRRFVVPSADSISGR